MEILIAFLIGLGLFDTVEEASVYSDDQIYEMQHEYNQDLIDQYGDEYISIFGTDETEIY